MTPAAAKSQTSYRAVYFQQGQARLVERRLDPPDQGEALLRPLWAGICHTDLELLKGYYQFAGIPGHEFVARVEQAPGAPELEGRLVVAEINLGCGECPRCRAGDPRHCPSRRVIGIKGWDGAFAELLKVPQSCLHPLPEGLDPREAVFTEPLAAALEITQQVHLRQEMKALVLGDGKLGLLTALALRLSCPDLLLAGRHRAKLAIAAAQGVRTLHAPEPEPLRELAQREGGFDLVVEATGRTGGLNQALELVRPQGTIVAKTTVVEPSPLELARLVVNEVRLVGSRCGPFPLALQYLARRCLEVGPLVEQVYPFDEFQRALEHASQPGALKILLRFPER